MNKFAFLFVHIYLIQNLAERKEFMPIIMLLELLQNITLNHMNIQIDGHIMYCNTLIHIEMGIDEDIINCKYFGSFIMHLLGIELLRDNIKYDQGINHLYIFFFRHQVLGSRDMCPNFRHFHSAFSFFFKFYSVSGLSSFSVYFE